MPTTRRRRSRGLVPGLSEYQRSYLLDQTSEPPHRDDVEAVGWYFFEKHLDGMPCSAAALWLANEPALLAEFTGASPGLRPSIWWRTRAPEPRRRLGGLGSPIGRDLDCGVPAHWRGVATFESQATYLRRHGLLLPGEARRLRPRDFEPERIKLLRQESDADDV